MVDPQGSTDRHKESHCQTLLLSKKDRKVGRIINPPVFVGSVTPLMPPPASSTAARIAQCLNQRIAKLAADLTVFISMPRVKLA
jgi:hypothetical protein